MYRYFVAIMFLWTVVSCSNPETKQPVTVKETTENALEPDCNFQLQTIKSLPSSSFKVVSGRRSCNSGQLTFEVLVLAPGEAIDNRKVCNVFATTDTAAQWQLRFDSKHIEIIFLQRKPDEATILMQHEMVYDSIEIVYSTLNSQELI